MYVKIKKEVEIFIPVKKAMIYIETKDLFDNIAYEEIFLFLGDGKSFDDIMDITTYTSDQVKNILDDFEGWKFIEVTCCNNTHQFTLTEEGKKIYRIIKEKHDFNDKNVEVYINCFSGNLEKKVKECKDFIDKDAAVLKNKVDLSLFNNLNQGYSKELYEDYYKSSDITDDDMSHINIRIEIKDRKTYFISKKISSIPNLINQSPVLSLNDNNLTLENIKASKFDVFSISGKLIKFNLSYKDNTLSNYENIISNLQQIESIYPNLISTEGRNVISLFANEVRINNLLSTHDFFLDTITGDIYKSLKINDTKDKADLVLDKEYTLNNIDTNVMKKLFDTIIYTQISSDFNIEYRFLKEISVINNINFEFLEQVVYYGECF